MYLPEPEAHVREQGARCMDCGIPFCHQGCPLGNLIPDWNDLGLPPAMAGGDRAPARDEQLSRVDGPAVPGAVRRRRACSASTTIRSRSSRIELSIVEHAFERGLDSGAGRRPSRTGKRVAVVGSGPAGLAAADQLNQAGHHVTVFERADRIGGLLRYGIPEFKLEKRFLDRRLALMAEEGVEFRTGVEIGIDLPVDRPAPPVRRDRALLRRRRGRAISRFPAASSAASTSRSST